MPKSSPAETLPQRQVPTDLTAEAMTLSALMLNADAAGNIVQIIGSRVSCFTNDQHSALYLCLLDLFNENKPLNDITVLLHKIKQRGVDGRLTLEFLHGIINTAPNAANGEYHALIILELDQKRRMILALDRSLSDAWANELDAKSLCDQVEARVFAVAQEQTADGFQVSLATMLQDMALHGATPNGIDTGFFELDNLLAGLHPGEFSILAARPSVGKTALALTIADHIAINQKLPVAVFSLEMRQAEILKRLICARAGVDMQSFRRNMMTPQQRERMGVAVSDLSSGELLLDDACSLTVTELRAKARRLKKKSDVKLFIIDYLQLMNDTGKQENRQQEITRISRGIKILAGELNTHILCLSQLNRASESENRRPRTSDLRESGSIEQDADNVMLLHREDVMNRSNPDWANENPQKIGLAELILAKQRNGPCGVIRLVAQDNCVRFCNPAY